MRSGILLISVFFVYGCGVRNYPECVYIGQDRFCVVKVISGYDYLKIDRDGISTETLSIRVRNGNIDDGREMLKVQCGSYNDGDILVGKISVSGRSEEVLMVKEVGNDKLAIFGFTHNKSDDYNKEMDRMLLVINDFTNRYKSDLTSR